VGQGGGVQWIGIEALALGKKEESDGQGARGQRGKDMRRAMTLEVTTLYVRGWNRVEGRARGLRGRGLWRWVKGQREKAQP